MTIRGRAHKYGANVDIDAIIPARYLISRTQKRWPNTAWRA